MEPTRTLIVDDEPLARRRLRTLLRDRSEIVIVAECRNGREAVDAIVSERPDLVFLDIQMPDLDGFGVLEAVGPSQMPDVVFVTAYDEYALDAFAVAALDYLLKPFEDERFELALERALTRIRQRRSEELCERLSCLVEGRRVHLGAQAAPETRPVRRFVVRKNGRVYFVPVREVDWIEADGAYVRLHTGARSHLVRDSIKRLETVLDPERFVRIHRSAMVHVDRIAELHPMFHGEYEVVLESGAKLKVSRGYRERVHDLLDFPPT